MDSPKFYGESKNSYYYRPAKADYSAQKSYKVKFNESDETNINTIKDDEESNSIDEMNEEKKNGKK